MSQRSPRGASELRHQQRRQLPVLSRWQRRHQWRQANRSQVRRKHRREGSLAARASFGALSAALRPCWTMHQMTPAEASASASACTLRLVSTCWLQALAMTVGTCVGCIDLSALVIENVAARRSARGLQPGYLCLVCCCAMIMAVPIYSYIHKQDGIKYHLEAKCKRWMRSHTRE